MFLLSKKILEMFFTSKSLMLIFLNSFSAPENDKKLPNTVPQKDENSEASTIQFDWRERGMVTPVRNQSERRTEIRTFNQFD